MSFGISYSSKLGLYDTLKKKLKDHQDVLHARERELESAKNQLVRDGQLFQGDNQ
jgi:Skp family chaperone for outer membrane proteins